MGIWTSHSVVNDAWKYERRKNWMRARCQPENATIHIYRFTFSENEIQMRRRNAGFRRTKCNAVSGLAGARRKSAGRPVAVLFWNGAFHRRWQGLFRNCAQLCVGDPPAL
jgi:hypothetical protein